MLAKPLKDIFKSNVREFLFPTESNPFVKIVREKEGYRPFYKDQNGNWKAFNPNGRPLSDNYLLIDLRELRRVFTKSGYKVRSLKISRTDTCSTRHCFKLVISRKTKNRWENVVVVTCSNSLDGSTRARVNFEFVSNPSGDQILVDHEVSTRHIGNATSFQVLVYHYISDLVGMVLPSSFQKAPRFFDHRTSGVMKKEEAILLQDQIQRVKQKRWALRPTQVLNN